MTVFAVLILWRRDSAYGFAARARSLIRCKTRFARGRPSCAPALPSRFMPVMRRTQCSLSGYERDRQ